MYSLPEQLWVTASAMHLWGNAAKWWHAYKQTHRKLSWKQFYAAVYTEFGSDDYRKTVTHLLSLK
jgi:hypothetical protein